MSIPKVDPSKHFPERESRMCTFGKRRDQFTGKRCAQMEAVRLVAEVFYGKRVMVMHLDFDEGTGALFVGKEERNIEFDSLHGGVIHFRPDGVKHFLAARFNPRNVILVEDPIPGDNNKSMLWVGSSYTRRRRVPLFGPNYLSGRAV